ncbi:MAG: hypothetical protein MJZ68_00505 [archaeon]|nr:hypothetical protein [archaeon]
MSYCPRCGRYFEGEGVFCRDCNGGFPETTSVNNGRKRVKASTVALTVIFIAVIGFSASIVFDDEPLSGHAGSYAPEFTDEGVIVRGENAFFSFLDGYDDCMTMSFPESERSNMYSLRMTLDPDIAKRYTMFKWSLTEVMSETKIANLDPKAEPFVTWYDPLYGLYMFDVVCTDGKGASDIYFGVVDVSAYYDFFFDNDRYTFLVDYSYSDYAKDTASTDKDILSRGNVRWDDLSGFVTTEGAVADLESALFGSFSKLWGTNPGKTYAEFLLCFVQSCYGYYSDLGQYGTREYYARPAETIFNNLGDSEDTAFLCTSLFKAAGFDTAVAFYGNETFAAVALPYAEKDYDDDHCILCRKVDGKYYYACTTTADGYVPVGMVDYPWGISYDDYENMGSVGHGAYGFYRV